MPMIDALIAELTHEAILTRKTLERVPESKMDWRPHPKSFTMSRLASHLAEVSSWIPTILSKTELDFAAEKYEPLALIKVQEMLSLFDTSHAKALEAMKGVSDEQLLQNWTLRAGETVYFTMPRIGVLRGMVLNHAIHHRAQLGLYLRLNDVPVPSVYGPSADEA